MKQFICKLYLTLTLIFLAQTAYAKDIEFVQITDLHFSQNQNSIDNFNKLITTVNSLPNINFVVFTGDNIDSANKDTLLMFLKQCKKLDTPYYIQIGNHDCLKSKKLTKKTYAELVSQNSKQKIKSFNYVVKKGDYVFIFVDGMKEVLPSTSGYYKDDTLKWLDKQLTKYSEKNVIIFQHFPLIERKPMSNHNLYMAQKYWAVLANHQNVKAIFSGHYHIPVEEEINGILHVVTPKADPELKSFRDVILHKNSNKQTEIYSTIITF